MSFPADVRPRRAGVKRRRLNTHVWCLTVSLLLAAIASSLPLTAAAKFDVNAPDNEEEVLHRDRISLEEPVEGGLDNDDLAKRNETELPLPSWLTTWNSTVEVAFEDRPMFLVRSQL